MNRVRVLGQAPLERRQQGPLLLVTGLARIGHRALLLELHALVDQQRQVAAVVQQQVRPLAVLEALHLGQDVVPVVLQRLALPGEDRNAARGDRGGGLVLGRVDVAARPGDLRPQLDERLDQHGGLDGHVQAAGDPRPGERLRRAVLPAQGHQAGHLLLGQLDFLPAPLGQRDVGDLVRQLLLDRRHKHILL